MSDQSVENNGGTTGGGVTGAGFRPGRTGNPGGRPKGLARATRDLVGDDGLAIAEFWLSVMRDERAKTSDRLDASRLLAERGWGKAARFQLVEDDDPLGHDQVAVDEAVAHFGREVRRLAAIADAERAPVNGHGSDPV